MIFISKKIKVGKIYRIEDGSRQAHPGKIYKAYKRKGKYDVIKFSTKSRKSYKLNENIDPNSSEPCFVRKRPERVGETYVKDEYETYQVRNFKDKQTLKLVKRNTIKIRGKKKR